MSLFPAGFHPLEQDINCKVLASARLSGFKVYLVGGYLREALAGRFSDDNLPYDFDYAVNLGSAIAFARQITVELSGHFVLLDEATDTARVVLDTGVMLDFAGCIGGTIDSDIMRRDFTINALAWDADEPEKIIDLVGGQDDLRINLIRAISEQNLKDDPLRLLRAFRFAATSGGTIDNPTLEMISRLADLLPRVAPERISYELFLIMGSSPIANIIKQMGDSGLLEIIFPELTATRKVTQNAFHHLGLWDHSLELVAQAEKIAPLMPTWAKESFEQSISSGLTALAATKLACLLHDIGKPETWQITPEGRHTFYEHDRLGSEMTERIAQRLRWAKPVERFIVKLVRWHLRPGQLFHQGRPTTRAIHRFYRVIATEVPPLILLALADLGATCGEGISQSDRQELENDLIELLNQYSVFKNKEAVRVQLLDGNDIKQLLKITPGPIIGELLDELNEAQSLNEVSTRSAAERFVMSRYQQKYLR